VSCCAMALLMVLASLALPLTQLRLSGLHLESM
jgi:hypothetical protein